MPVTENVTKKSASVKMAGTEDPSTGKIPTYSASLGVLSLDATADEVKTVADLLSPCLAYETTGVTFITTSNLTGTA